MPLYIIVGCKKKRHALTLLQASNTKHIIHVSLEGALPAWAHGGVGSFVNSLSRMQARYLKEKDIKVYHIVPHYLRENRPLPPEVQHWKELRFQAKIYDPHSHNQYQAEIRAKTGKLHGVNIFAVYPDEKNKELFHLAEEGSVFSLPEKLKGKLTPSKRCNYFEQLAAHLIKQVVSKEEEKQTILHMHSLGATALYLKGSEITTVNTVHSKPPKGEIPQHLTSITPARQTLRQRTLGMINMIHTVSPKASKYLTSGDYQAFGAPKEQVGQLSFIRSTINRRRFSFEGLAKRLPHGIKSIFSSLPTVEKRKVCLDRLQISFSKKNLEWSLDRSRPTVLFIGRLCRLKGIDLLESAITEAKNQGYNFILMGIPQEEPQALEVLNRLKAKFPTTPIFDNASLQKEYGQLARGAADLGLLLSFQEEGPLVPMEYQSYGTHCLFADVGGASYSFPQINGEVDPTCGTKYQAHFLKGGGYDIGRTKASFSQAYSNLLEAWKLKNEEQRSTTANHIMRVFSSEFAPKKWVKEMGKLYREASARKAAEVYRARVLLPELKQVIIAKQAKAPLDF